MFGFFALIGLDVLWSGRTACQYSRRDEAFCRILGLTSIMQRLVRFTPKRERRLGANLILRPRPRLHALRWHVKTRERPVCDEDHLSLFWGWKNLTFRFSLSGSKGNSGMELFRRPESRKAFQLSLSHFF